MKLTNQITLYIFTVIILLSISLSYSSSVYYIIGIVVLGFSVYVILKILEIRNKLLRKTHYDKWVKKIKLRGKKFQIDLMNCEIDTREETVEVDVGGGYKSKTLDYMYDGRENIVRETKYFSEITFFIEVNGIQKEYYSPIVNKDRVTLSFLLEKQKTTSLYISRTNSKDYYIDLEFLVQ